MRRILFDVLEINIAVSLVILLVWLFEKRLCKKYGVGFLKMVWVILAMRLLIPYNFSLPFTELRLLSIPGFEQEENIKSEVPSYDMVPMQQDIQLPAEELAVAGGLQVEMTPEMNIEAQQMTNANDASEKSIKSNAFVYSTILAQLWIMGIVAGLCYFIICSISFYHRYNKFLHRQTDTAMLKKVNEIQEKIMGQKRVAVYESSAISSPMLIGLLHIKLVFPASPKQWQDKELEYIVSHELWHYRNRDLWLKLLLLFVWCLNWWNPFILLMKRKCFFYMELACDACVLKGTRENDRGEYAEMLLRFAGRRTPVSAFSTNFGSGKKRMRQRIDYALETHNCKRGTIAVLLISFLVIGAGLFISCGYKPEELDRISMGRHFGENARL